MYAQDSIDLLIRSGIEFQKNEERGIDVFDFGELLITSGIVLNDNIKWISFHSGYDFGYLLKVLTCKPLPAEEAEFFESVKTYFPCIYDIKYLMKSCKSLKGGLNDLAEDLKVERYGPKHQAGSDSMLTLFTFFKMKAEFFNNAIDDTKFLGVLYGLSEGLGYQLPPNAASNSSTPVPEDKEQSRAELGAAVPLQQQQQQQQAHQQQQQQQSLPNSGSLSPSSHHSYTTQAMNKV
eukprot:TRINITY_DN242_c3_g1_i2.p1 TRINITY_DN242_c3_g1~~TRINITY_DN242_c3_g1_i2.p1  ORF type:complete len:235 (+),score=75.13 TRINITY_DN242_c3_g1_i2:643-1347(+)